jgi:hypothetical protein
MKINLILIVLLAGLPLGVLGQATMPSWTEDAFRELHYPADEWYTGFARNKLKTDEELGDAIKKLEQDAKAQLAESIILKIEETTKMKQASESIQSGNDSREIITSEYEQDVKTATSATTVGCELKSHYEPSSGALYAFAVVRRADLATFYQKQIDLDLNEVENALSMVNQLIAVGKKMSASQKCFDAMAFFANVTRYQKLLSAVNLDANAETLQTIRSKELQETVTQTFLNLEQSTFVYVDCQYEYKGYKDDAFSSDPGIICDIVKQALSENQCSVVDDDSNADYTLTLSAYTTQRSDGSGEFGIISYYANVRGSLYNHLTKKKTVDFAILNDPNVYAAGRTPEIAATKAFKLPALKERILGKILPKIKN